MDINIKPNDIIHSYRFEHPIGYGAYGVVWKGLHEHMHLPVAIKVIDTRDLDPHNLERVKQECRIGGKLAKKANVVEVRDAFPEDDYFYIVMELMTGGSLERYLHDHPHPDFDLTLAWALDLCLALAEVHAVKIIHRDLKPHNILLTDDAQVKLSDFGVAHLRGAGLTTTYQPGTYGYQAPEQEANQRVDAGADVFALCAVLFEIWSGKKYFPFKAAAPAIVREEMNLLLAENYPDLSPALCDRLIDTVLAGLRPHSERISLANLQDALQAIQADWQQGASRAEVVAEARKQVARRIKPPVPATIIGYLPQRPVATPSQLPGDTALTRWLEDQFGRWYTPTNNLVLWFDPNREWEPLLEHLSPNLNLIRFQGSQLEVRYRVEQRPPDRQTVVYLPLKPDEAGYLLPYHFTSRLFDKPVYDFLLEQGTPLPRSARERSQIRQMLPQLIQESIGKGPAFWQGIVDLERAQEVLIRDFSGRLGQFLDQPVEILASLDQAKLAGHFQAMVEARLGYTAPGKDSLSFAQGLVAHLCLVELYCQTGGPNDFPFKHILPDPTCFDLCRSTLDTWRNDRRYQHRFVEYTRSIEADYPSLIEWARAYAGQVDDPPLPGIARAAWEHVAGELAACTSFQEVIDYLEANRQRSQHAAAAFWATIGETPGWLALDLAGQVMPAIRQTLDSLNRLKSPADFIRAYTGQWWQIDRNYRQAKSVLQSSFPGDQTLAGWLDRLYQRFLTDTNQRWTSLLSEQKTWGFPGLLPAQTTFWSKVANSKTKRRAIFLVDALRYELGETLREQLKAEDVSLEAMLNALPSVTPVGMSALLPEADKRQIGWQGKEWRITLPDFDGNLADKAGRAKWWRAQLDQVDILTLTDLLRSNTTISDDIASLIVTAVSIDAIGENTGALTPTMLADLVSQIARGVRKAIKVGFDEIHVTTDHGFLLLDRVAAHGKAELPAHKWLKKSSRYAVGRNLPATEHLTLPIPGSQDLVACFPHGVVCFKSPGQYNYAHGGPSLQEVIIPHLTVRTSAFSIPVKVEIQADAETRVAFFKVTLKPVKVGLMSREREVRLVLERADGSAIRQSDELIDVEEPVVKNLQVKLNDNVAYGDTLYVTVYDAGTRELLARHTIRFLVSLDL